MSRSVELPRLTDTASADEIVDLLEEHGGVIVEGMIDAGILERLNAEIEPHVCAADPAMTHVNPLVQMFFGDRTRHVVGLAAKSRTFATDVLCHPTLLAVCDRVLGPSCARYQLNVGQTLQRGPGSEEQFLHRDEDVWIHMPQPHPHLQVASMTALVDFTDEIGATRIIPGSHRWPRERQPEPHEIAVAEMPAGSTALYLGSTIHGGGANTTELDRRGLHLSYVVGWLRTEENNYLAVPPEIASGLPRATQELLGYAVHDAIEDAGGYLGAVELVDPVELMARGELPGSATLKTKS